VTLDEAAGGFDVFRRRAASGDGAADPAWRIGFDARFRSGFERDIVRDVAGKLDMALPAVPATGAYLVDIGAGSGELTDALTDWTGSAGLAHVVVDAGEMLAHLQPRPGRRHVAGRFPDCSLEIADTAPAARFFLAYSVLQYVLRDGIVDVFLDALLALMPPGSVALLGDVPNRDTRARQRAAAGIAADDATQPDPADIHDRDVLAVLTRARAGGVHGYVLPQPASLALSPHREDIVLVRPGPYPSKQETPRA
jgi:hypothetical protein